MLIYSRTKQTQFHICWSTKCLMPCWMLYKWAFQRVELLHWTRKEKSSTLFNQLLLFVEQWGCEQRKMLDLEALAFKTKLLPICLYCTHLTGQYFGTVLYYKKKQGRHWFTLVRVSINGRLQLFASYVLYSNDRSSSIWTIKLWIYI